jgi:hypothetical protein
VVLPVKFTRRTYMRWNSGEDALDRVCCRVVPAIIILLVFFKHYYTSIRSGWIRMTWKVLGSGLRARGSALDSGRLQKPKND